MLMKNCIILSILLSLVAMSCLAIPAKRVKRSLTLADGTTVMATLVGDENGHWYVDDKGNATKPFLLPQRNPWKFYHDLFDAYNVPDFTKTKVEFDAHEAHNQLWNDEREKVRMKANIGH